MVPIGSFYLGASSTPPSSAVFGRPQSMSQASLPYSPTSPPSNQSSRGTPTSYRASMPATARGGSSSAVSPGSTSAFINQPSSAGRPPQSRFESTLEEGDEDTGLQRVQPENIITTESATSAESKRKSRGVMNPEFKFPPSSPTTSVASGPGVAAGGIPSDPQKRGSLPTTIEDQRHEGKKDDEAIKKHTAVPSRIEVPAPPLVEKETDGRVSLDDLGDDDVGDTVDIPLN